MKKSMALAAALALYAAQTALAQPNYILSNDSLGLIHNASIEVLDDVTGGCWTNAEAIKQKARLTLEQSGISAYLEPLSANYPYAASIYIKAFGERSPSSSCYGAIEVVVSDTSSRNFNGTYLVGGIVYFRELSAAIGGNLNKQFATAVENSINKLAADILSGRRNDDVERLIEQYSDELSADPETFEEWKKRMEIDFPTN